MFGAITNAPPWPLCWFLRQVGEALEKSGPVYRLGARLSEIQAGLTSVQKRLEQRSPNVSQAKLTQRVSDQDCNKKVGRPSEAVSSLLLLKTQT